MSEEKYESHRNRARSHRHHQVENRILAPKPEVEADPPRRASGFPFCLRHFPAPIEPDCKQAAGCCCIGKVGSEETENERYRPLASESEGGVSEV